MSKGKVFSSLASLCLEIWSFDIRHWSFLRDISWSAAHDVVMSIMADMPRADEVARLVDEARTGSEEAFAELVRRHHADVRLFLVRFVRQADAADDLAQEVFLSAYRSLASYETDRPFGAWLLGIARHRALHWLRTEARRLQREGRKIESAINGLQLHDANALGDDVEQVERELAALRRCLRKLPEHGRQLVDAFYYRNESAESLAQRLGRSSGAVRMMLMRVRRALSECVQRKLSE
jgi:RNA polymerase sigma-70 factor, ECF subfamily